MACVSDALRHSLLQSIAVTPCLVAVVHNGVDNQMFTPAGRQVPGPGDPFRVLFVGVIAPHKKPDLLLRAVVVAWRSTRRAIELRIVGSSGYDRDAPLTDYERYLRSLAQELATDVEFTPCVARHDLPSVYRAADFLAVQSVWEKPCSLVILEAKACGTPVVASGRGGPVKPAAMWRTT